MVHLKYLFLLVKAVCYKTERYCIPVERLSLRVCTATGKLITNSDGL